ncbi:MAG: alpha/beta hydrolase [Acidobacteria bacterium]|nr:alpha/beta hydrolase [Acidobacteriota bacterium]
MKFTIALFVTLCAAAPFLAQSVEIGSPPGRLVDIGGRKLHLNCTGSGSPTVILEAGASSFAIDWTLVQPEIARTNRVCSYDRAGMGWSDPATGEPRDNVTGDLHTALKVAQENPPYLMVGASMGGIYVWLFKNQYPDEVVGMVLVDPASEERLFLFFEGKAVEVASLTAEQRRSIIPPGSVKVPRRSPQTGAPFDRLPRELYELRIKLDTRLIASVPESIPYEAVVATAEIERARLAKLKKVRTAQPHPLGDRPIVVLTRGVGSDQAVRDVHARLAGLSTNSRHTVVADAGHEIHLFQPGAVIQAIRDVSEAFRSKKPLPAR